MTQRELAQFRSVRDQMTALRNDLHQTEMRFAALQKKCDHKFPNGNAAWIISKADNRVCHICGNFVKPIPDRGDFMT